MQTQKGKATIKGGKVWNGTVVVPVTRDSWSYKVPSTKHLTEDMAPQLPVLLHQHSGRHADDLVNAALIVVSGFLLPERSSFPLFTRSVSNFLWRSLYLCYLHSPPELKLQLLQNHLPFIKTFFKSCSLSHTYFYSLPYKITFVEHLPHARPKRNSFHKCSHFKHLK